MLAAAAPQSFGALAASLKLVLLAKLLLATILGGAVGLERELSGKPAGLRTNILICVGAALFMHLSIVVAEIGASSTGQPYGDTTRIAAQIVSGIGFLGAGAILHARGAVVGLTTAATIWVVAAIGAAVGAGGYVEAVGTTVLVGVVLVGLRPVERWILAMRRTVTATVRLRPGVEIGAIEAAVRELEVEILSTTQRGAPEARTYELRLAGTVRHIESAVRALRRTEDVTTVTID